VRNGLTPVEVYAWEIRNALDPAWLATLEQVVAENRMAGVSATRRADLMAYLEASALFAAETGRKIHALTDRIGEANRAVVDIVAQFEEHVRRDMLVEPVDVASLVAEVARAPLKTGCGNVEIVLPEKGPVALANRILLRQVVSNVFINAAEAIEAAGRRGIVRVVTSRQPDGMVGLTIADNGEGIARERIATLFQRGVSSRSGKRGGLGLHWCANAMKLLGGAIRAESGGVDQGASFVLTLPAAPAGAMGG
jgi:C4-dicarboxylate-specific signal transduction histidine kinase